MNTKVRTAEHAMKAAPKHDKKMKDKNSEVVHRSKIIDSENRTKRCMPRRERKIALLQDVDKLRKKLRHEENVHRALERAFTRPLGALPRLPPYLPTHTLELLAEVAVLEEEVVRLEEQVVNFRQGLYLEAIYISSSKRTMESGVDSCSDRFSLQNARNTEQHKPHNQLSTSDGSAPLTRWPPDGNHYIPSSHRLANTKRFPKKLNSSFSEGHCENENQSNANTTKNVKQTLVKKVSGSRTPASQTENQATEKDRVANCFHGGSNEKACEEASGANKLSEEILRCLMSIFTRISLPKSGAAETETFPSVSGSCDSSEDVGLRDPYDICAEFGRREIGPYKHVCEVNMSSFDANLISKCSFLTCRLKLLLRKLASVSISELSHQQKLAFWINVYNLCMMNAFLENGIPTTPEMIVALMPKAMVNIGGQVFSAMTIEHFILRLPYQSKHVSSSTLQVSPKGLKCDEMTRRSVFGLDWPEPLVTFALSCGSWSSPAVRVYTASQVEKQLQEAKRDYLQAAVGVSKPNRLAIPKLLDWYLLDFANDIESLMDWICLQMPSDLRNDAVTCLEQSKRSSISNPIQVLPYEFRFRYLLVL